MGRIVRRANAVVLAALAAMIVAPIGFSAAQQRVNPPVYGQPQAPRGFFDFLFSPLQTQPYRPPPQPVRPRNANPVAAAPQAAVTPAIAKDPSAKKILVIGDFVASVVAAGLDQAFSSEAKVRVVDRDNPNSGLARQDYYDWARQLPGILTAEKPDVVVVVLGANDRQQLLGASTATWGTPEWDDAYGNRVAALAGVLAASGGPYLWVGIVPMRSVPDPDLAHINDLTEARLTASGASYVDVWDGFADDGGRLVISGPDVNGQTVPLRTPNGINFTAAGQAKLAFFLDRDLRKVLGVTGTAAVDVAALSQAGKVEVGPDGKRRVVGPIISLGDPAPGTTPALAGQGNTPGAPVPPLLALPKDAQSPQAILIRGAALPVVTGRADDFTWPRPATPMAALPAPAATGTVAAK